jgi:hypothetical protein
MVTDHISVRMAQGTMSSVNINTTVTYVMWREGHVWNVGGVQQVRLSSSVSR